MINAGKQTITMLAGSAVFDSAMSFGMIRAQKIDLTILGAMEVSEHGDIANWKVPGEAVPGVGGAMDLAVGTPNIFVAMSHVTNKGKRKIVKTCAAPLTARQCVKRIYTDLAIIDVTAQGLVLREVMPGNDPASVQAKTEANLIVAPDWREMDVPETATNGARLRN